MGTFLSVVWTIIDFLSGWMVYRKMGHEGWEGIIPIYRTYVICKDLYGNGWKCLLLWIPLYGIYFRYKIYVDVAHGFHKNTVFGLGLAFFTGIFQLILGFGAAVYGDGTQASTDSDFISDTVKRAADTISGNRSADIAKKLEDLKDMYDKGIISETDYNAKKEELLKRM